MSICTPLLAAAKQATDAAEALATATDPAVGTHGLKVGDHPLILRELEHAITALTGWTGVLASTPRTIRAWLRFRSQPGLADDGYLLALDAARQTADAALEAVERVDLGPARLRVDDDCKTLAGLRSFAANPWGRRNQPAALAREASARIALFGEAVWAPHGSLHDVAFSLDAAASIARSLAQTCLHEASLVDAAYAPARAHVDPAPVTQDLTSAATELGDADNHTVRAVVQTRALITRELALPPLPF